MDKIVNRSDRIDLRRKLRQQSTGFEYKLWQSLRNNQMGCRCRRQSSIGPYVVDFCFPSRKVIIELDGVQHEYNKEYDFRRDVYLRSLGYTILRFWNSDLVEGYSGVLDRIYDVLHSSTTSP